MMLCKITRMSGVAPEESRLIKLPKNEQELNVFLQDMGIGRENDFAYAVSNIKTGCTELDQQLNQYFKHDIDELNHIAGFAQKFNKEGLKRLSTILEADKPVDSVSFINRMHNQDGFQIYENVSNFKELGEEAAFQVEGIDPESPVGIHVNYEAFGQDYHETFGGAFINGQYVIPPTELKYVYDGVMLPGTDNIDPKTKLAVKVVSGERFGIDDDSRGIWIKLPTTEYALDRAAHRLGEESIDGCFVNNAKYPEALEDFMLDCRSDIRELNSMAEVLESYSNPAQMEKLEAVLEYEGDISTEQAINIAANLDCYNYDPEITTAEDFIIKHYDNDPVKLAQANDLDGEKLLARCGGKITENGFVARNDLPMEQVYEPPEQPQYGYDQGMTMQ